MTRCALYRCLNDSGRILYVGITNNPKRREWEHRCRAPFAGDLATIAVEWFDSRAQAAAAEAAILADEKPIWNTHGGKAGAYAAGPVAGLIAEWPTRQAFADAVGANVQSVHKWAQAGRIPAAWQASVIRAARARGMEHVTGDWMVAAHARGGAAA